MDRRLLIVSATLCRPIAQLGQRLCRCGFLSVSALILFLGFFGASSPAHAQDGGSNSLETVPCDVNLPAGTFDGYELSDGTGIRIDCAYLTVPEIHAEPNGPTLRLFVLTARSSSPNSEPLVLLQGGPGGSGIEPFLSLLFPLFSNTTHPVLQDRDIIILELRGTLRSKPNLACTETLELTRANIERNLTDEESLNLSRQALDSCFQRLQESGANLAAFNRREAANDVESLRAALGYSQINLYGVSYGTAVAQEVMRLHPQTVGAVILDAVVPVNRNFIQDAPATYDTSLNEVFEACQEDADCQRQHPDLETEFLNLVDQLNAHPIILTVPEMDIDTHLPTGTVYHMPLDGDSFVGLAFQIQYQADILRALPQIMTNLRELGKDELLSSVTGQVLFSNLVSEGAYYSEVCAAQHDFQVPEAVWDAMRPQIANSQRSGIEAVATICQDWEVPSLEPGLSQPVTSDIPTLIISGRFDPVTPAPNGALVAATLGRSYQVVLPNAGHGAGLQLECPQSIVRAFLRTPGQHPDMTCVDTMPPLRFITPSNTVMTDQMYRMLNLDGTALLLFGVAALGTIGVLSAWVIWPLTVVIALWRRWRDTPEQKAGRRPLPKITLGLQILIGLALVLFLGATLWATGQLVVANDITVAFGFPGWTRVFFLMLPFVALATLGLLVWLFVRFRHPSYQSWRRIYALLFILVTGVTLVAYTALGWMTAGLRFT